MDNDRTGGHGRPDPRPRPRSNQTPGFLAFSGLGLLNALCLAAGLSGASSSIALSGLAHFSFFWVFSSGLPWECW